ncbi:MAG: hypothetical protein EXR67_01580 [Dehalococcoidia bacterium]|nr:hypothetical protein [Dehalococcoidia bacterium]
MEPLYHLFTLADRNTALKEIQRILHPGGIAIVAYLNTWGLIRTGVTDFPEWFAIPGFLPKMLGHGELNIWHCSNPQHAQAEVNGAGFEVITYAGAEGPVGGIHTLVDQLAKDHPKAYEQLLTFATETSELPQFRDTSDHLHLVVRKPEP